MSFQELLSLQHFLSVCKIMLQQGFPHCGECSLFEIPFSYFVSLWSFSRRWDVLQLKKWHLLHETQHKTNTCQNCKWIFFPKKWRPLFEISFMDLSSCAVVVSCCKEYKEAVRQQVDCWQRPISPSRSATLALWEYPLIHFFSNQTWCLTDVQNHDEK